jgi:hypothetical protein
MAFGITIYGNPCQTKSLIKNLNMLLHEGVKKSCLCF